VSYRWRQGSIGAKGFCLRTGFSGSAFGKAGGKNDGAVMLILIGIMAALVMLALVSSVGPVRAACRPRSA
jgi:hypothetical protein